MNHNVGIVKESKCPTCGSKLDAATCLRSPGATARPGDFTICFECGEIMIFTDDLGIRLVDLDDMMQLDEDNRNEIGRAQQFARERKIRGLHG